MRGIVVVPVLVAAAATACGTQPSPPVTGQAARLSSAGADGDTRWSVSPPRAAFVSAADLFLVVWSQHGPGGPGVVRARAVGTDGMPATATVQVSPRGEDADAPAVTAAADGASALVTWIARLPGGPVVRARVLGSAGVPRGRARTVAPRDAATPAAAAHGRGWIVAWRGLVGGRREIRWRLLGPRGRPLAPPRTASTAGGRTAGASFPAVAAGALGPFVAWRADGGPAAAGELEVFGRLLPHGRVVRLSSAGPDGDVGFAVGPPALASSPGGFLVAWSGDTEVAGERELFVRRLAVDGSPAAAAERATSVGRTGDPEADALGPALACGSAGCAVAWWGDPELPPLEPDEAEVFLRRLDPVPTPPLRLSAAGPDGEYLFAALDPAIAAGREGWLVAWKADDDTARLVNDEFEVYARAVSG